MLSTMVLIGALALQGQVPFRQTGQALLRLCDAKDPGDADNVARALWLVDDANCSAYIEGVADTLSGTGRTCPPQGVTLGQNVAIAVKYLKEHPARLHEHRTVLLAAALMEAFPCRKSP